MQITDSVEKALAFIGYWNGPIRPDEGPEDSPGSIFLHRFLQSWASLEVPYLESHLAQMDGLDSAFATAIIVLQHKGLDDEVKQLLDSDNSWIRWAATLLTARFRTEKHLLNLLSMLKDCFQDEILLSDERDRYSIVWFPRLIDAVVSFQGKYEQDVVKQELLSFLSQTVLLQNKSSSSDPTPKREETASIELSYCYTFVLYALGMKREWKSVLDLSLSIDENIRLKWMVQLSLGALHEWYPPKPFIISWRDYPELEMAINLFLRENLSLDKHIADLALKNYEQDYLYMGFYGTLDPEILPHLAK